MTIVVGFSASRQSQAPLNLAVQMAAASGHSIVAVAVVEDSGARAGDPFQKEFIGHLTERTETALRKVLDGMPGGAQVPAVVTPGPSTATGLLQVAADHDADAVVVGSSSSGLMGRLALGSVTDRIVHTARLPVAIAPPRLQAGSGPDHPCHRGIRRGRRRKRTDSGRCGTDP